VRTTARHESWSSSVVRLVLADSVRLSASAWWLDKSSHRSSSRDYGAHCQPGGPTRRHDESLKQTPAARYIRTTIRWINLAAVLERTANPGDRHDESLKQTLAARYIRTTIRWINLAALPSVRPCFGCTCILRNPHVSEWIEVELYVN
jgi:hypothetical protein